MRSVVSAADRCGSVAERRASVDETETGVSDVNQQQLQPWNKSCSHSQRQTTKSRLTFIIIIIVIVIVINATPESFRCFFFTAPEQPRVPGHHGALGLVPPCTRAGIQNTKNGRCVQMEDGSLTCPLQCITVWFLSWRVNDNTQSPASLWTLKQRTRTSYVKATLYQSNSRQVVNAWTVRRQTSRLQHVWRKRSNVA